MNLRVGTTCGAMAAALLASGCVQEQTQAPAPNVSTNQSTRPLAPCDSVNISQSMVVHDQATISLGDFSFQRTMAAIRNSSGGATTTDSALAETIKSGLLTSTFINPVSGLAMPADPRNGENQLTGAGLLTEMHPIALFNRFDLAPANGSNCGEYRIVYGRYGGTPAGRYLLIFESRLPNPNPGAGLAGCAPVAQFWHNLSDPGLSNAQRAQQLEDFYFSGLPGFSAVVTHDNYGVPLGQVRANMFVQGIWQLREWRTGFNVGGEPVFTPDTVKDNPLAQLYNAGSTNPNPALFSTEQAQFQTDFTTGNIFNLLDFEVNGSPFAACPEVNGIGAGFSDRYNEFQSDAQGNQDNPNSIASTAFRTSIDAVLSGNTAFSGLTNTHVLNRAGTVTCGGCHQFSNNQAVAPGVNWPSSAGFVHVVEPSGSTAPNPTAVATLSAALNSCFLPARKQILEDFVCSTGGGTDAGVSDSGNPTDAGNPADAGTPDSGTPVACGGPYGATCAANEYCEFGPYNICGANGPGVCTPRPTICPYVVNPVCGCDGATYNNDCLANAAGTDVSSAGACGGSCNLKPPSSCCYEDKQCAKIKGGECIGAVCAPGQAGVCKGPPPKGGCWEEEDCGRGQTCVGERICPCGARCLLPDSPGQCRFVLSPAPVSPVRQVASSVQTAPVARPVADAKQSLLNAGTAEDASRALSDLEAAVRAERELEAAQPGAFWRKRRTH